MYIRGLWRLSFVPLFWTIVLSLSQPSLAWLRSMYQKPQLVVVSPVPLSLETRSRGDALRQVFEVEGRDAAGCIHYAGATEILRAQTAPVFVYLRPLPRRVCNTGAHRNDDTD